jgi:soluble lytic murein transglycosylase-like protein
MSRSLRLLGAAVLVALIPAAPAPAHVHTVAPGETLSGIAAVNGIPTGALAAANGLTPTAFVISGTRLQVPAPGGGSAQPLGTAPPVASASGGGHLVRPGETLSGIAAANGLSTAALAGANGLSPTSFAIAGTRLRIPAAGAPTEATGTPAAAGGSSAPEPMGGYIVKPGDTLSELALRSRVPVAQMAYMNGLRPDSHLVAGTPLKLPTGAPAAAASGVAAPAPQVVPQAAPAPSSGRLSAADIHRIAGEHGVPGSLAAAIAWQESGFNNAMVSSANARGVMQVMPGTWDWVQTNLSKGRPLDPASPADNVRAGSLYLGQLLRETNGDPAMAAAAYYQGLSSVRRIGMLPETRRYVANVLALRGRFGG